MNFEIYSEMFFPHFALINEEIDLIRYVQLVFENYRKAWAVRKTRKIADNDVYVK